MKQVQLTHRALRDIAKIDAYTLESFGPTAADKYIAKIDLALETLSQSPDLLRAKPNVSGRLSFYPVGKHFLVCDVIDEQVYVIAVIHGSMDLPERIGDLEPQLIREVEILHERCSGRWRGIN